jgi:hypothetical protein
MWKCVRDVAWQLQEAQTMHNDIGFPKEQSHGLSQESWMELS